MLRVPALTGGQQVPAALDIFAAVPDAATLPRQAQQSTTTFAAVLCLWLSSGFCQDQVGWVYARLGQEGRRPDIRDSDRQCLARQRHGPIDDAPLFGLWKASVEVQVPMSWELSLELAGLAADAPSYLLTDHGKAFASSGSLDNRVRKWIVAAG